MKRSERDRYMTVDRAPATAVTILGAGPAGLAAAFRLSRRRVANVTVLEQASQVGGIAASFDLAGVRVDNGSHRLHRSCVPAVLEDIRGLLGADLLDRPRHGRIHLRGRWVCFPLRPGELAARLPLGFSAGVAFDLLRKTVLGRDSPDRHETFATVLERGLGPTICRDFYFPYAQKIWGLEPQQISPVQAYRRVSTGSLGRLVGKVLSTAGRRTQEGSGRFFYPLHGFGQISEAYARSAQEAGAGIVLNACATSVEVRRGGGYVVRYELAGRSQHIEADQVWSTVPITRLIQSLRPAPPDQYLTATKQIHYRAMVLVYLVLEQDRFSEYDAHYFPSTDLPITRLSEPKNYSGAGEPAGLTVLCAELPCVHDGAVWHQSDDELGVLVRESLATAGIPVQAPVRAVATRRHRYAYPIYRRGYEEHFGQLDQCLRDMEGLLALGRQGLFVHDNVHHAMYMGYCAADCLDDEGRFDRERWQVFRRQFEEHVVED